MFILSKKDSTKSQSTLSLEDEDEDEPFNVSDEDVYSLHKHKKQLKNNDSNMS